MILLQFIPKATYRDAQYPGGAFFIMVTFLIDGLDMPFFYVGQGPPHLGALTGFNI